MSERCKRCDDPACDVPAAEAAIPAGATWPYEGVDPAVFIRLGQAFPDCYRRPAVDEERATVARLRAELDGGKP